MFSLGPNGVIYPASEVPHLKPNALVVISNILLNGQFRLNYVEWRLIFAMLAQIEENDTEFKEYYIRVQDIIEISDLKSGSHLYEEVSKNIKSLMSHVVTWEEEPLKERFAHLISDATYYKKQGIVKLIPHPDMKPHLLQLKNQFTQAQLKQCIKFSSSYTSRIYMLLKQFDNPKAGHRVMSIDEFRFKLCLDYTEKLSKGKKLDYHIYPKYSDMRRWILEPAQKEIATTDIDFTFTPIKTGRKVTAIKFVLTRGKKVLTVKEAPEKGEELSEKEALVYGQLSTLGFTDFQIRQILHKGNLKEIHKVIYEVKTTDYNNLGKPIKNKSAYAYGIFKKKFGLT